MHPLNPGYFDENDLREFGFKEVGENVRIGRTCTIVGLENITIGNNVRIDGYCTISAAEGGLLTIGSFIHIGAYCSLLAGQGIHMADFSGLSQGVRIYSKSDDYSGRHLTNPTIPAKFAGASGGPVSLERHVIIGAGSRVPPYQSRHLAFAASWSQQVISLSMSLNPTPKPHCGHLYSTSSAILLSYSLFL